MDLILVVICIIIICIPKINKEELPIIVKTTITTETGEEQQVDITTDSLVVGKNLGLLREARAYYKILDEMGLS